MSTEVEILDRFASFTHKPYEFVMFAFPWGEAGGDLALATGPEPWQEDFLRRLGADVVAPEQALRYATSSGNGIGKSSLVSWLILWAMATHEDTRGVITANTEVQLVTKTWAELSKWYRLFIGRFMFDLSATRLCSRDPDHANTWRVDMIPWSERNPEAFSGLHNKGKRILIVYDEASAIHDTIWEKTEGALTDRDTEIIWATFSNPTRNSGRFFDCFHSHKHRWVTRNIDSRTVRLANRALHDSWVEDYGVDSDFVRIHVRGEFPRQGVQDFISAEEVRLAMEREVSAYGFDPLILGVDVARHGDDATVIYRRRGRDAKSLPFITIRNQDLMFTAGKVAELFVSEKPDAIFIDVGGAGAGAYDRLQQLHIPCIGVDFGAKPEGTAGTDKQKYANKRASMWGALREWIRLGGGLPNNRELERELIAPQYFYQDKSNAIVLESKKDMKARGQPSPNIADALALTFAFPVGPRQFSPGYNKPRHQVEYDPFASAYREQRV